MKKNTTKEFFGETENETAELLSYEKALKKDNSIINSLKRLERVGEETSVVTQKLKYSCEEVAGKIYDICHENLKFGENNDEYIFSSFELPAGIRFTKNNFKNTSYLMIRRGYGEENLQEYTLDENVSRENALKFSKMIADGWLDKFTNFLKDRKAEELEATQIFELIEL